MNDLQPARLLREPLFRLGLAVQAGILATYALLGLGVDLPQTSIASGSALLLVLLVAVACYRSASHRQLPAERRFRWLLGSAFFVWLGLEVLHLAWPIHWPPAQPARHVISDGFYVVFFLFVVLAAEEKPHLRESRQVLSIERRVIRRAAVVTLALALFGYTVLLPQAINTQAYDTLVPSYLLHVAFGGFVASRFFRLSFRARGTPWSSRYLLLAAAFLCWGIVDAVDLFSRRRGQPFPDGTALDLLFFLPFLLILGAVLQDRSSGDSGLRRDRGPRTIESLPIRADIDVFLTALLLPFVHYGAFSFGLLDEETRSVREMVVLAFLAAQALLAIAHAVLASATLRLQSRLEKGQRMEALGRLAGGVAHDFNNLLTVVIGSAELLREQLDDKDKRRGMADQILSAGERATGLTRQLLAFSRRQVLHEEVTDLNEVLRDMDRMFERVVEEEVRVRTDLESDLGRVLVDRGEMERVVINLVMNARDAMPGGGTLEIRSRNVEVKKADEIYDPGLEPGHYVSLAVTDTGCGMDDTTREHIFEPFFTTKERSGGTGLGMATVFGIVKQSDGSVRVRSSLGEGTTIEVLLPRLDGEPVGAQVPALESGAIVSGGKVLVVEDDDQVRRHVADILERRGLRVVSAGDAVEALQVFETEGEDLALVVSDVVLPGENGVDLFRRLQRKRPSLRVVFMTGHPGEAVGARDGFLQGVQLLHKPFTPDILTRAVSLAMSGDLPPRSSKPVDAEES